MKQRGSRVRSIRRLLLRGMLWVVVIQAVIYVSAIMGSKTFGSMRESAYRNLKNGTSSLQLKMQQELQESKAGLDYYASKIQEELFRYTQARDEQVANQLYIEEEGTELLRRTVEELKTVLRNSRATEVFLILETGKNSKQGLCLRDIDVHTFAVDDRDLRAVVGPEELLSEEKILPSDDWTESFDLSYIENTEFYDRPMSAARACIQAAGSQILSKDLGYWSCNEDLTGEEGCYLIYTVPLRDQYGIPYGVVGMNFSGGALTAYLNYSALGMEEGAAMLLCAGDGDKYAIGAVAGISESLHGELVTLHQEKSIPGVYALEVAGRKESRVGAVGFLRLYGEDTVYTGERWTLISAVEEAELLEDIHVLQNVLMAAFALAILLGVIVATMIRKRLATPIEELVEHIRQSDPSKGLQLPRARIREVDELAMVIESLTDTVAGASERLERVLDMINLKLGVIAYEVDSQELFCTDGVYEILDFSVGFLEMEEKSNEARLEEFRLFEERVIDRDRDERASILAIPVGEEKRWIRFVVEERDSLRLVMVQDYTKDMEERKKIEYERDYDLLTGLLGRRAFRREAEKVVGDERYPLVAAAMWDLDNLKNVNDRWGHDYGDLYIQAIAGVLERESGENSLVCRRSGDEFIVLLY